MVLLSVPVYRQTGQPIRRIVTGGCGNDDDDDVAKAKGLDLFRGN